MKEGNNQILFKDLAIEWLNKKKDFVKESTYANYSMIMYNHLVADFGELSLDKLNHNFLQQYILEKLKNGEINKENKLSQKSVKDIMMVLKNCLHYAMNEEKMNTINLDFLYPKNFDKKKLYVLSRREQRKITEYAINNLNPTSLGVLISLYSGMRIGELCALKWSDIDFRNNIIHVNKTLQRIYIKNEDGTVTHKIIITPPKTINSNRDIPISKEFADIIKTKKENSNHYVLTSTLNPTEPRNYRRCFGTILKRLKIKPINFHALRHTFATNCISLGIDYKTVSELLGHSNITTTLNLYVHPNLSQKKKCMNMIWKNHN